MAHDDVAYSYQDDVALSRRPRSQWTPLKLILALVVGGSAVLMVCGGGCAAIVIFGMNVLTKEIELELRDNPALVEHVGEVESFELDWMASIGHPDDDVWIFQVQGTKGSGEITAKSVTMPDGNEHIEWATLRLSHGETVELVES